MLEYFENFNILMRLLKGKKLLSLTNDEIISIQIIKLNNLLNHAYKNISFYKTLMDSYGVNPSSVKYLDDLSSFPIITKKIYRDYVESTVSKRPKYYKKKFFTTATSGSTGMPMEIYRSSNERAIIKSIFLRTLIANGFKIRDRTYWITPPQSVSTKDSILQRIGVMPRTNISYFESDSAMLEGYIESKSNILISNKSQLVQMALYAKKNDINIEKPKFCICLAEVLDSNSKRVIKEVFGSGNLINIYGAMELSTLAYQIAGKDFLYPVYDSCLFELDNKGTINSKSGNAIITHLDIYSFPLIRYKLGDWLEMTNYEGLPVIREIQGRFDDWIIWKDGTKLPYWTFYVFMTKRKEVDQFRIIQENYHEINVEVVLKKDYEFEDLEPILIFDLKREIKDDINYTIILKEVIMPSKTGKLKMVESKIK